MTPGFGAAMNSRRPFDGARCLATGASTGLGRSIAERLARQGATVLMTARTLEPLDAIARTLASDDQVGPIVALDANLGEAEGRNKVIHAAASRLGALDLVVQSAPIDPESLIELARGSLPLLQLGFRPALVVLGATGVTTDPVETIRSEWSGLEIQVVQVSLDSAHPSTADREAARVLESIRQDHLEPSRIPEGGLRRLARRLINLRASQSQAAAKPSNRLPQPHFRLRITQLSQKGD
jgi:NAD(P)-dependent dehydrogenase (short-subunit alcohol dehydrogenase family)